MNTNGAYRVLSIFLVVIMLFTTLPAEVFATDTAEQSAGMSADGDGGQQPITELNYVKAGPESEAKKMDGSGTEADPYTISTGAQLWYFAQQVNGGNAYEGSYITLKTNVDMEDRVWTPVGFSKAMPFMGYFDGEGHEIINLRIAYSGGRLNDGDEHIGFFGYIKNAQIKNVGIRNYTIDQNYAYNTTMGALVAYAEGSSIEDCYADRRRDSDQDQRGLW